MSTSVDDVTKKDFDIRVVKEIEFRESKIRKYKRKHNIEIVAREEKIVQHILNGIPSHNYYFEVIYPRLILERSISFYYYNFYNFTIEDTVPFHYDLVQHCLFIELLMNWIMRKLIMPCVYCTYFEQTSVFYVFHSNCCNTSHSIRNKITKTIELKRITIWQLWMLQSATTYISFFPEEILKDIFDIWRMDEDNKFRQVLGLQSNSYQGPSTNSYCGIFSQLVQDGIADRMLSTHH